MVEVINQIYHATEIVMTKLTKFIREKINK